MSNPTYPPASLSLLDKNGSAAQVWELADKKTFYIGRSKSNDITLPFTSVSRQHAMLQVEENGAYNITDLGSSNGTIINGQRHHSSTRLHSGDRLQFGSGKTTLIFLHDFTPQQPEEEDDDLEEETVAFLQTELVTILVCDIRNFTSISEKIGSELVGNILTIWSKKVDEIVRFYKGSIDKFIGDAVMATWVGGNGQAENITLAMKTAVAISDMTTSLSRKTSKITGPLTIGGAINTGEAVIGNIGVSGHRDFTVVGDVVNVTFRLEELTSKIKTDMLIGPDFSKFINAKKSHYFTPCRYVVKGKEKPITAFGCSFAQLKKFLSKDS